MACGTCGGSAPAVQAAQHALADLMPEVYGAGAEMIPSPPIVNGTVRLEFIGSQQGAMTYIGSISGRQYRAGREPQSRFIDCDPRDVAHFLALERFAVVNLPPNRMNDTDGRVAPQAFESATRQRAGR